MDIFFQDPNEIPLPPGEVRIRDLQVRPWSDGQRIRVYLELDPFQRRPSAELVVHNPNNIPVAAVSILESMTRKIELTMHLRNMDSPGQFTLHAQIYYQEGPPDYQADQGDITPEPGEKIIVDQKMVVFETPA